MKKIVPLILSLIAIIPVAQAKEINIIPLPQFVEVQKEDSFTLSKATAITFANKEAKSSAELLAIALKNSTGFAFQATQSDSAAKNSIHFKLDKSVDHEEGYKLVANNDSVTISATASGGYFYGSQTLLQLLPTEIYAQKAQTDVSWEVPAVKISDYPTYQWRGMMLDVSRYFMNKEYVMKYLDMMAMHKLNIFHWHLIDDCGWRIEIKKYPKLTEIGAWRGEGEFKHGGFYTHEDIKEIVAYAAARNISVVPEIEMPAHTLSALASYPYLGCTGQQFKMPVNHSISPEIYCVGRESTWKFLEDVMDEVASLFPYEYIHIGGDEARYDRWNKCEHCQAKIKEEGLKNSAELQGWASTRLQKYVEKHNKKILGWAEILDCGVTNKAGIMSWHKPHHSIDAAKNGNPVMAAIIHHTYFDTPESNLPGEPPAANWLPPVTLSKAYNWDPTPEEIRGTPAAKNILGPNGCLWTDRFLHEKEILADKPGEGTSGSEAYVDYLTLPRMSALAEVAWTKQDSRNYDDYLSRLATHFHRYQHAEYNFRLPTPDLAFDQVEEGSRYTGKAGISGGHIRYTTDGSAPDKDSKILEGSVIVAKDTALKAATFTANDADNSLTVNYGKITKDYSEHGVIIGEWKSGKVGNAKPMIVSFDATGKIDSNGEYIVTFLYTSGESRLDIDGIEVLRNDTEKVAKDTHHGFTGGASKNNTYTIKMNDYQTGASYKINAAIYGDINSDTNGVVLIKKK